MLGLPSTLGWRIIAISRKFTASSRRFARPLLKDSILMDESLHLLVSLSNQHIPNSCPTLPQALARLRNRSLSKGLQTWLVAHNRRQHVLAMTSKVVRHWRKRALARPFETWRVHAKQIEQGKALLRKVVGRMQNGAVWRAFDTWLTFNSHLQHARHNLEVSV